ncbi:MAG: two-component regulator propeller domain-containing protein, partial [Candidatus Sumerlaeota bacterium]
MRFSAGSFFFLLCFLMGAANVPAQRLVSKWHSVTPEDGLSQGTVYSILQDKSGFMWFGTGDGLNRYDGREFVVFRNNPQNESSLTGNLVFSIVEDRAGFLWIGTQEGISRYDSETGKFLQFKECHSAAHTVPMLNVNEIIIDRNERIFGATETGLCVYDAETKVFDQVPSDFPARALRSVSSDTKGNVWVAGADGIAILPANGTKLSIPKIPEEIRASVVTAMLVDRADTLWAGTAAGLYRLDLNTGDMVLHKPNPTEKKLLPSSEIYTIRQVSADAVVAGTRYGGWRIRRDKYEGRLFERIVGVPNTLTDSRIYSVYTDRSRNLWLGTFRGGANHVYLLDGMFPHYVVNRDEPGHNSVRTMLHEMPNFLWVGTEEEGLFRCNLRVEDQLHFNADATNDHALYSNTISALTKDHDGRLWVGAGRMLHRLNDALTSFDRFDPAGGEARDLQLDVKSNVLWFGTTGGLFRFDITTETFTAFHPQEGKNSLSSDRINALAQSDDGTLWIGTADRGLVSYDPATRQFENYQHDVGRTETIISNEILSLLASEDHTLWVGTSSGLSHFDPSTKKFAQYGRKDGFANETICGILPGSNQELWVSTYSGVTRLNTSTRSVKNFDVWDGLQDRQFIPGSAHKTSEGELYFGGFNGFNAFFPDHIIPEAATPKVVITQLRIFNEVQQPGISKSLPRPLPVTDSLELEYKDNMLTFHFAALDFTAPLRNQYAHKLEPYDNDWIETGNISSATYTGLPGGDYTLRVKASNNFGQWNNEGASLRLRIKPPFWQTWQFRVLLPIAGILLVIGIIRYRFLKANRQKMQLQQLVDDKTSELQQVADERARINEDLLRENIIRKQAERELADRNREVKQFAYIVSHDLKAPLVNLQGFTAELEKSVAIINPVVEQALPNLPEAQRREVATAAHEDVPEAIGFIRSAVGRMDALVQALLKLSRIGRIELDRREVDLNEVTQQCTGTHNHMLVQRGATVRVSDLPTVLADKTSMEQVMGNLITNAVLYLEPKRPGMIDISGAVEIDRAIVRVRDNGRGIHEADMDKVFAPFRRAGRPDVPG